MATNARPYDAQKMTTRQFTDQLISMHGGAFNEILHPDGYIEGVLTFGPPGIGKTHCSMAAAREMAQDNNCELVIYKPGLKATPGKREMLFVHMSMAGMTSGGIAGFPTVKDKDKIQPGDTDTEKAEKTRRYVSQQVIPEIWRVAMDYERVVYLFDEITHVVSQEAMLSLLSEGFYAETELSKRALFIATANEGIADGTLPQKLSTAFRNRFTAYYMRADVDTWRKDFANVTVHPCLLAYAKLYSDKFETFQMPKDNLLNIPTLRGLTMMSDELRYFEARKYRRRNAQGDVDPRGELIEDTQISPADEFQLQRLAYGRLGDDMMANDFVALYSLAFKSVVPEVNKIIAGKIDTVSTEFKNALNTDSDESVARQKAALAGKSSQEKLKDGQNAMALKYTYIDYLPRLILESLERLPSNPKIMAHAKNQPVFKSVKWDENGDKLPNQVRDAYASMLMGYFLDAVLLLPPKDQLVAIIHLKELSFTQESREKFADFTGGKPTTGTPAPFYALMAKLTEQSAKNTQASRLSKALEIAHASQQTLNTLDIGS